MTLDESLDYLNCWPLPRTLVFRFSAMAWLHMNFTVWLGESAHIWVFTSFCGGWILHFARVSCHDSEWPPDAILHAPVALSRRVAVSEGLIKIYGPT